MNHLISFFTNSTSFNNKESRNNILLIIWNNIPDKIARTTFSHGYNQGGLKMININNFLKAIKATWIKRLLATTTNSDWKLLLTTTITYPLNLTKYGSLWYRNTQYTIHS